MFRFSGLGLFLLAGLGVEPLHVGVMLNVVTGPPVLPSQTRTVIGYFQNYLKSRPDILKKLRLPLINYTYFPVSSSNVSNVATSLANDVDIDVILAPYSSGQTFATAQAVQLANPSKPILSAGAASENLFYTTDSSGTRTRVYPNLITPLQIAPGYMSEFITVARYNGASTVAIVHVRASFHAQVCAGAKDTAESAGMSVVNYDTISIYSSKTEANAIWAKLIASYKQSKPDVIIVCSYAMCSSFLNQAYRKNYLPKAVVFTVCGEQDIEPDDDIGQTGNYLRAYAYFAQQWHYRISSTDWQETSNSSMAIFPSSSTTLDSPQQLYNRVYKDTGEAISYLAASVLASLYLWTLADLNSNATDTGDLSSEFSGVFSRSFYGIVSNNGFGYNEHKPLVVLQYNSEGNNDNIVGPFEAQDNTPVYPMPSWEDRLSKSHRDPTWPYVVIAVSIALVIGGAVTYTAYYYYHTRKNKQQARQQLLSEFIIDMGFLLLEITDFITDGLGLLEVSVFGSFSFKVRIAYAFFFTIAVFASCYNVWVRLRVIQMLWSENKFMIEYLEKIYKKRTIPVARMNKLRNDFTFASRKLEDAKSDMALFLLEDLPFLIINSVILEQSGVSGRGRRILQASILFSAFFLGVKSHSFGRYQKYSKKAKDLKLKAVEHGMSFHQTKMDDNVNFAKFTSKLRKSLNSFKIEKSIPSEKESKEISMQKISEENSRNEPEIHHGFDGNRRRSSRVASNSAKRKDRLRASRDAKINSDMSTGTANASAMDNHAQSHFLRSDAGVSSRSVISRSPKMAKDGCKRGISPLGYKNSVSRDFGSESLMDQKGGISKSLKSINTTEDVIVNLDDLPDEKNSNQPEYSPGDHVQLQAVKNGTRSKNGTDGEKSTKEIKYTHPVPVVSENINAEDLFDRQVSL